MRSLALTSPTPAWRRCAWNPVALQQGELRSSPEKVYFANYGDKLRKAEKLPGIGATIINITFRLITFIAVVRSSGERTMKPKFTAEGEKDPFNAVTNTVAVEITRKVDPNHLGRRPAANGGPCHTEVPRGVSTTKGNVTMTEATYKHISYGAGSRRGKLAEQANAIEACTSTNDLGPEADPKMETRIGEEMRTEGPHDVGKLRDEPHQMRKGPVKVERGAATSLPAERQ